MRGRAELFLDEIGDGFEFELGRLVLRFAGAPVLRPDALEGPHRQRRNIGLGRGVGRTGALQQPGSGNTVDGGVVQFRVNGKLAVPEALDQVHFPEGAAAVEQRGMQPRDEREQLAVAPGLRQCRVADVVLEIHFWVRLPVEWAEASEHAVCNAVAEGLAQLCGRAIGIAQPGQEFPLVSTCGKLEQAEACYVHRGFTGLELQKARV